MRCTCDFPVYIWPKKIFSALGVHVHPVQPPGYAWGDSEHGWFFQRLLPPSPPLLLLCYFRLNPAYRNLWGLRQKDFYSSDAPINEQHRNITEPFSDECTLDKIVHQSAVRGDTDRVNGKFTTYVTANIHHTGQVTYVSTPRHQRHVTKTDSDVHEPKQNTATTNHRIFFSDDYTLSGRWRSKLRHSATMNWQHFVHDIVPNNCPTVASLTTCKLPTHRQMRRRAAATNMASCYERKNDLECVDDKNCPNNFTSAILIG